MLANGIDSLEIEPTTRCNAGCPMCSRTGNPLILENQSEITFEHFQKFFPPTFIHELKQIKFCGNFGDPAIAKDLIKMHEYVLSHNPNIIMIMSTNGGIRGVDFWTKLGKVYARSPSSRMEFHIDGLEDTNHIYRIGVRWKKVMDNAAAFINAGGTAHWYFIPFFHNEHQVEEAEQLSKQMGFKDFIVKVSARFKDFKKPFVHSRGKLYPPTADRFNIESLQVDGPLRCVSEARRSAYVDAWGRFFPCCWTASRFHTAHDWSVYQDDSLISLHKNSINSIIQNNSVNQWLDGLYKSTSSVCHAKCTGSNIHGIERDGIITPQKILWLMKDNV